jgi:hypothetical protein
VAGGGEGNVAKTSIVLKKNYWVTEYRAAGNFFRVGEQIDNITAKLHLQYIYRRTYNVSF